MAMSGYRNRWVMIAAVVKGEGEVGGVLADGSVLRAPECAMLLSAVAEVHDDRSYTPDGLPLEPNDLVVDVGAHVGVFAIHAARITGGVVHAYEPSPVNFGYLVENIERNAPGRIVPYRLAVSDREGPAALFTGRHSVGHSLIASPLSEGSGEAEEIRSTTLEAIVAGVGPIDFLKLDCEGAEGLILGSTPHDVLRSVRKIALEYHDGWSPLDHRELAAILEAAGFSVAHRSEGGGRFGYLHARRV
jgi:FkbM family methyltransferase